MILRKAGNLFLKEGNLMKRKENQKGKNFCGEKQQQIKLVGNSE